MRTWFWFSYHEEHGDISDEQVQPCRSQRQAQGHRGGQKGEGSHGCRAEAVPRCLQKHPWTELLLAEPPGACLQSIQGQVLLRLFLFGGRLLQEGRS